jgi:sulfate-transporting ATPase
LGLEPWLDTDADQLSHAVRRLVAIARALATDPLVLLLDEPAAGLDPGEVDELGRLITEVAAAMNIGVLVIAHELDFVARISDRITVLDIGRVIASGLPSEVAASAVVRQAYLGVADLRAEETMRAPELAAGRQSTGSAR